MMACAFTDFLDLKKFVSNFELTLVPIGFCFDFFLWGFMYLFLKSPHFTLRDKFRLQTFGNFRFNMAEFIIFRFWLCLLALCSLWFDVYWNWFKLVRIKIEVLVILNSSHNGFILVLDFILNWTTIWGEIRNFQFKWNVLN